ncbi:hypothetical protein [Couchioplanes caeruleus]|uniref:Uncharacterized protein n=2 Tax=Couchioplanes caeruleus TaxID=56438 RepID=A0A1K0GSJ9_9ACTN|nr:hypothetical protein [Couchioplanes caeruleus]OJF14188.1 hypothetical protein BG844_11055 [Couchioplanes caeruleus subsp. caeruleus]ROP28313.1 hypothetical protein EDD30_1060 [Couchioplanes caeruleus]
MKYTLEDAVPFAMRAVMVGPSRVGKTSLMTTLLEGGRKLLGGTRVSLQGEPATEGWLRDCRDALADSLSGEIYDPGRLGGSDEIREYDFVVNPRISGAERFRFPLTVLDYPGRLLRPDADQQQRQRLEKFVSDTMTLLIPVDATVIMEAKETRHIRGLSRMLQISDVEEVIREWAKHRPDDGKLPIGTIALCPVKGESYFADNGGTVDRSMELLEKVTRLYLGRVLEVLGEEEAQRRTSILYCPVDTIGPIRLHRVEWEVDGDRVQCAPTFVKRGDAVRRQTKGAEELFAVICAEALANVRSHWQGQASTHAAKGQAAIRPTAGANKTWFYLFEQWDERLERRQSRLAGTELLTQLNEFDRAVTKVIECRRQAFEWNVSRGTRFAVLHQPSEG